MTIHGQARAGDVEEVVAELDKLESRLVYREKLDNGIQSRAEYDTERAALLTSFGDWRYREGVEAAVKFCASERLPWSASEIRRALLPGEVKMKVRRGAPDPETLPPRPKWPDDYWCPVCGAALVPFEDPPQRDCDELKCRACNWSGPPQQASIRVTTEESLGLGPEDYGRPEDMPSIGDLQV